MLRAIRYRMFGPGTATMTAVPVTNTARWLKCVIAISPGASVLSFRGGAAGRAPARRRALEIREEALLHGAHAANCTHGFAQRVVRRGQQPQHVRADQGTEARAPLDPSEVRDPLHAFQKTSEVDVRGRSDGAQCEERPPVAAAPRLSEGKRVREPFGLAEVHVGTHRGHGSDGLRIPCGG